MKEEQKKVGEGIKEEEEKALSDEYGIDIHGRTFITFGGLLKEAHSRGIINIATNLLKQSDEKDDTVIVQAIVTLPHPTMKDKVAQFTALGDANKYNIRNEYLEPHKIRIAETRAIARALRFALGIGYAAKEEMAYDGKKGEDEFASVNQIKWITDIRIKNAMFDAVVHDRLKKWNKDIDAITKKEADVLIKEMPKQS